MTRRPSPAAGPSGWRLRREIVQSRETDVGTFDPVTHTYAWSGRPMLSVTQYLTRAGLIDYSAVPEAQLAQGLERGSWVHAALHYLQEEDFDLNETPEQYRGYLDSALAHLETVGTSPLRDAAGAIVGIEARFWDTGRWFAGTMDRLSFDRDGVLAIDDWKSGEPSEVAAPLQLAAYEFGARKHLIPQFCPSYTGPIRRRAVKLFRDGRPARVEVYTDPRDLQVFFAAVSLVNYRERGMTHDGA